MLKIKIVTWMLVVLALVATQVRAEDEVAVADTPDPNAVKLLTNAEKLPNGFLIVQKVFPFRLISGSRVTATIEIHNAGQDAAYDITFTDDLIGSAEGLKLVKGNTKETFNKIAAGDYVSFTHVYEMTKSGNIIIPEAKVSYSETEKSSKKVVTTSPLDGFKVQSPAEARIEDLLSVGAYVSLGFCKTGGDWIRLLIVAGLAVLIFGGRTTMNKVKTAQDSRRRTLARRALGVEELMKES